MSGDDLKVQVPFIRVRRGLEVTFQQAGGPQGPCGPPTPLARCVARAHLLSRALDASGPGALARIARQSGVSRQRLAQIHTLVYLAPELQEAILMGTLEASRVYFADLLRIAKRLHWSEQRALWEEVVYSAHPPETNPGRNPPSGNMPLPQPPQKSGRSAEPAMSAREHGPTATPKPIEGENTARRANR